MRSVESTHLISPFCMTLLIQPLSGALLMTVCPQVNGIPFLIAVTGSVNMRSYVHPLYDKIIEADQNAVRDIRL